MRADPIAELNAALERGMGGLSERIIDVSFERPKRAEQGDFSTNAALQLAPIVKGAPRTVAEELGASLSESLGAACERVEVAGPGFLNLFMSDTWYRNGVEFILSAERFGSHASRAPAISLEFVSANPTGPLTAAGGRGAAYGDSLARVLEFAGHEVKREYYLNDAGAQVKTFGASIAARMRGEDVPDDGYAGAYVTELALELAGQGHSPDDESKLAQAGTESMRARIAAVLERFGVRFDHWASERELLEAGALEATLATLRDGDHTYESEGALWLRTTGWGDDKDRVLVRSDGEPTYFASDIAYHRDKLARGAEQMIVPLGADHHGYIARMKAAVGVLTGEPDRYEAPIMQLVNIVEGGERTRMSKRRGEFVTLEELIEDVGADAARYFLLARSHDTVIDLDLELARSQSQENPVFYVQYAHARLASILRRTAAVRELGEVSAVPVHPSERRLVKRLLELPAEVEIAAARRAPHRICAFAQAVASDFHGFYRDCKVVGADEETGTEGTEAARVATCIAAQGVIARCLGMIGVAAPDRM
jgi:arginyl-tRNA synthetase